MGASGPLSLTITIKGSKIRRFRGCQVKDNRAGSIMGSFWGGKTSNERCFIGMEIIAELRKAKTTLAARGRRGEVG